MASQDLHSNIKTQVAVNIGTYITAGTTTGHIIDTNPITSTETGYESLEFIWITGTIVGALGTFKLHFIHGSESDLSDGVAVDPKWLIGNYGKVFGQDENHLTNRVGYVGKERYVRCDLEVLTEGSDGTMGVVAILGMPRNAPRPDEFAA